MPLFLVMVEGGLLLARADNEDRARLLAEAGPDDPVHYVPTGGPEELIVPPWMAPPKEEVREIEITNLSDKSGVRRFLDPSTGVIRTETRPT